MFRNLIHWERDRPGRRGVRLATRPAKTDRDVFGGTPNTAVGTTALPRIRVHLRPFAITVAVGLPSNLFAHNVIHIILYAHDENLTISAEKRKTYGRLLGMIFLGGVGSTLVAQMQ